VQVRTGDRVGLVGANGCGKTTMVRVLAGDVEPTAGTIVKSSPSLRVAFLKQEFTDELVTFLTPKPISPPTFFFVISRRQLISYSYMF
jgi:ATPase subunit of ABC transporter with duplicated ATPase domains